MKKYKTRNQKSMRGWASNKVDIYFDLSFKYLIIFIRHYDNTPAGTLKRFRYDYDFRRHQYLK